MRKLLLKWIHVRRNATIAMIRSVTLSRKWEMKNPPTAKGFFFVLFRKLESSMTLIMISITIRVLIYITFINISPCLYNSIVKINSEKPCHHYNCDINTPVCRQTMYRLRSRESALLVQLRHSILLRLINDKDRMTRWWYYNIIII